MKLCYERGLRIRVLPSSLVVHFFHSQLRSSAPLPLLNPLLDVLDELFLMSQKPAFLESSLMPMKKCVLTL